MLRLKKYPKSPYWQVRGTVAGKLIHQSTGTTDRAIAEKFRRKLEKETYDYFALGEELPATFADAVTVYAKKGGEKKYLTRLLDYFKEKPLKEIGQQEINDAVEALYPNAKASTINRSLISPYISVVRSAIKAELPGAVLRPIERRKEQKPIVTPADDEHIARLLPHCSEGLAALITLMTYTGLRTGEALRVKKEDVKDGYVGVGTTKNGEPRRIPVPDGWSYPDNGFGYKTTQGVGRALRSASKGAKIVYRDGHEIGRHAFAARWLASGNSIKGLKEAGGWKKLAVVDQSYGHLEQTAVHETMRELSRKKP
jgi:integrase